jgi:hypothetical protein
MIGTLRSPRRFARRLNRGKEHGNERGNDGNHNQQLNERKRCDRNSLSRPAPIPCALQRGTEFV